MSGEKDLEQLKREAVAKAKAEALAKRQAKLAGEAAPILAAEEVKAPSEAVEKVETKPEPTETAVPAEDAAPAGDDAKAKAAAAAKAKAAAAAKAKAALLAKQAASAASKPAEAEAAPAGDDAKAKAIAAAKAKAAAAAKAKAAAQAKQSADSGSESTEAALAGDDAKAKAIAAAKAKAAAAAKAKAATSSNDGGVVPAQAEAAPSANQHYLDKYKKVIEENLGSDLLEDSYINKLSKDVPTLVVKREAYFKVAQFLKFNEQLGFDYASELHGTDFETHMEVYVHLFSYKNKQSVALKVKLDRNEPVLESVVALWPGANWPECEAYDLLGIKFEGHPNLHRILLGDDWIGHPQRKDYEPYDVEV